MKVSIIGAGIGGLSAALYLSKNGFKVNVFEATASHGGLAKNLSIKGFDFDAGPYILLDKPGLEWAFNTHNLNLEELQLKRIDNIYSVQSKNSFFSFYSDFEKTISEFNELWEGQGDRYKEFVGAMKINYESLFPMTFGKPGPMKLLKTGKLSLIPFLFGSLGKSMDKFKLNEQIKNGIGIWTHIAAQSLYEAPSPMAFVPNLMHNVGSYYPKNGIGSIADILFEACKKSGVQFHFNCSIEEIKMKGDTVIGLKTQEGEHIPSDFVMSNNNAIGTYMNLIKETPPKIKFKMRELPLQSPGICAFLKVKGSNNESYIQFKLDEDIPQCKSFIFPDNVFKSKTDDWKVARLIFPLPHQYSLNLTDAQSRELIDKVLEESWWKKGITDYELLDYNTPKTWGTKFSLYNRSMNPVMTSKFMLAGRIAHKSPYFKGLYFSGSSTHPGQWVSFCAISGILAAKELMKNT